MGADLPDQAPLGIELRAGIKMCLVQCRPAQVRPSQIGSGQVRAGQVCTVQVGPGQISLAEVKFAQFAIRTPFRNELPDQAPLAINRRILIKVGPVESSPGQVGIGQVGPAEIGPLQASTR